MPISKNRPIRSYVLRQGRLTKFQANGIKLLSPMYLIPFESNTIKWDNIFENKGKKIIEIGFGMGDTTAEIAETLTKSNFIAIDVHPPGVGNLLNKINEKELKNLKIIQYDAVEVLKKMVINKSLDAIHIFFPDPWHKKRHNKRRLIQEPFLELISKKLKKNGYIHIATDWEDYANSIINIFNKNEFYKIKNSNFFKKPSYRPKTKYENRGVNLGHKVWDIIFVKV
ncbi:tRNA (guanosine(46)-N7)-methyltransferase TrmB [Nitrosomonadales bacterium]|nr:tRNA (guanosine(46)-N7)-methyltransferase TrmB [Nitrosomonadales bacterium]